MNTLARKQYLPKALRAELDTLEMMATNEDDVAYPMGARNRANTIKRRYRLNPEDEKRVEMILKQAAIRIPSKPEEEQDE